MSSPSRDADTTEDGPKVEDVSALIELSFTRDNSGRDLKVTHEASRTWTNWEVKRDSNTWETLLLRLQSKGSKEEYDHSHKMVRVKQQGKVSTEISPNFGFSTGKKKYKSNIRRSKSWCPVTRWTEFLFVDNFLNALSHNNREYELVGLLKCCSCLHTW